MIMETMFAFSRKNEAWMPFAFCAFLSIMALAYSFMLPNSGWYITYLAFLPMCFYMVGTKLTKMNNEILQLRRRIEDFEKKASIL
jgi:hypothetical protein